MKTPAKPAQPVTNQPEKKEPSRSEVKAQIKALSEKLNKMDAQRHSGAASRLPKSKMLDASALEAKDPDHHYLYVETSEAGNLQGHLEDGYVAVGEQECKDSGVRQRVGDDVLMRIPRDKFEERIEDQKQVARDRMEQPRTEFKKAMEGIVRELRDRGYSDHDITRMMVDE